MAKVRSRIVDGVINARVPPVSCLKSVRFRISGVFCRVMPPTKRSLTLTTSLNINVKTPVLIFRLKAFNVGLVISGITLSARKASVGKIGTNEVPATSSMASLLILI